ncbi:MAG: hypothetical protein PHI11_05920 [Gallionella sp.]|nr:hypothetical protein [Gallionella sp.]
MSFKLTRQACSIFTRCLKPSFPSPHQVASAPNSAIFIALVIAFHGSGIRTPIKPDVLGGTPLLKNSQLFLFPAKAWGGDTAFCFNEILLSRRNPNQSVYPLVLKGEKRTPPADMVSRTARQLGKLNTMARVFALKRELYKQRFERVAAIARPLVA